MRIRVRTFHPRYRGMTLVEIVVSTAILASLAIMVFSVLLVTRRLTSTGDTQIDIQEFGRNALEKMADDLRFSGRTTVGGKQYPRLGNFSNVASTTNVSATIAHKLYCPSGVGPMTPGCGVPPGYSSNFAHPGLTTGLGGTHLIVNTADPEYAQFTEASREVILVQPQLDVAGRPVISGGSIVWDPTEISYVIVRGADGVNQLQRRTSTGDVQVVGRYVERMTIEDMGGSPDPDGAADLTGNQLRVTLYLAKPVGNSGTLLKARVSRLIVMRNSALD